MTTKEPILTPDIEALLQRYIDATAELLRLAGKPVSHVEIGTNLHLQMEVIVTLEHAVALLGKQLNENIAAPPPTNPTAYAALMGAMALSSVRHSILVGIIRVLKERTGEVMRMARGTPNPMLSCNETCAVSKVDDRTATHSGRALWRVVCPVHGLIHPGTTSGEHWVQAHQERGEVWPGKDDHVPPGTDIPVPAGHPGIVITPMGKKEGGGC